MRALLVVFLIAITSLALACGGGDSTARTEDGLRDTVRAYTEAVINDNPRDAYGYFTASCKERLTYGDYASRLMLARGFFKATYDMELNDAAVDRVDVADFDSTAGSANAGVRVVAKDDPDLVLSDNDPAMRPWRFELGSWRTADCERYIPASPTPTP